ncbi:MAG: hypothetical protein WCW52_03945 [Elusimicrobiales bacterium]|jgi:hypothetical protein
MTGKLIFAFFLFLTAEPLRAGTSVLWIPREHAPLEEVITRIESDGALKLTAALGEVPPPLADRVKKLASKGRLELAARPAGDPLIPLFYYAGEDTVRWLNKPSSAAFTSDPFFIALRMSEARDSYTKNFGQPPASFACAPGGIAPEYIPLAKALGFKWLAAGPFVSTAPFGVIDAEGVTLVPFTSSAAARPAGALFLVFDETMDRPGTDSRTALLAFLSDGSGRPYLTVSEALENAVSTSMPAAQAARFIEPWSGDYTPWAGLPAQAGALTALARTRTGLMEYLNARQGDYKAARAAFTEYFSVESGPKLLRLSDPDPEAAGETEIEIQGALGNAYRLMDKVPPGWLFSALSDMKEEAESSDKVTVRKSSFAFTLENSVRQAVPPAAAPAPAKGMDPYKLWKLARVGAAWTDDDIVFSFATLEPEGPPTGAAHYGARFDLYMDINSRPRAGSIRLLDGRAGRVFPDNAWEYALEVSPNAAALYTATAKGPQKTAVFKTAFENGSFTVRVPRTALRGNPELWNYAAFMLYTADDRTFAVTDFLADDFSNGYYYAVRPGKK